MLNDLNLEEGEARTTQDRPHVLSLTGAVEIPKTGGLQLSGSLQYQSGTPFTLTDSTTDDNRNGLFDDNRCRPAPTAARPATPMRSRSRTTAGSAAPAVPISCC